MLLYQPDGGYCYNSDSILLYGFITHFNPKGRMLDVGAGCGIVGLLVGRDCDVQLEAVEKQSVYTQISRRNAQINNIEYCLHECDFLEYEDKNGFDWIVSNPPFYSEGSARSDNPIIHQARYNVHMPIVEYAQKIAKLLRPQGSAVICYDARQFAQLCSAFEAVKLRVVDVQFVHSKSDRPSTLVMFRVKKNSKSAMNVWAPLITFENDSYTPAVQAIYDKAKAHSIKCQI
ncbi:MAG TPA: methyltransferase [Sulfuricurvum sp.]|nr:MAG: methyltransferase [Campylobacterales bacterium 16-40-21]OZA03895.1 MAG: methyltransferase [Sulfuricurvum sp. 17-40-25]HQS65580.1 methyltransferase [Sulfuricurvum sp.]HQT36193.1 methyltransferase [Sulfuricurvum sp.]